MEYPGGALSLTLKRQDLGAGALAVAAPEGVVQLRALVQADGSVRSVEVLVSSGSSALDRAASDAVRQWQFAPAARDGTPIDAYVTLRIRYVVR
jgi:protein TonB